MIANSSPELSWLAPQAAPVAQIASDMPAPAPSAIPSPEQQQLKEMSLAFATVRQSVDQLAASQQQMADGIAKLTAHQQQLLHKISAPPPRPAPAPARKPVTLPSSEAR
jgi:septal ring factor EnvC (AmiA/AmiB activator)